jgi:nucleotide-binding universal stress UspA family protein
MDESEALAQRKIEEARLIAGMRVSGRVERVRPGQEGYFLAEQARKSKAEAIVVGMRRRRGVPLYGQVLETVLRERPCRVIVVSESNEADGQDGAGGSRTPGPDFEDYGA